MQLHSLIFRYKMRSFSEWIHYDNKRAQSHWYFLQKMRRNTIPTEIFGVTVDGGGGVDTWDKQDTSPHFPDRRHLLPWWGLGNVKPGCRQWVGRLVVADGTAIISLSHDSQINAWLGITSYEKFVGITLVEMIDRVCLALLAQRPAQLWLDITTSIFPHTSIVGSLREEEFIIRDSGGSTRVRPGAVSQVGRSRRVETGGFQTFLEMKVSLENIEMQVQFSIEWTDGKSCYFNFEQQKWDEKFVLLNF